MPAAARAAAPIGAASASGAQTPPPIKFEPPRTGPAEILLFPTVRRTAFIARAGAAWDRYSPRGAERYLQVLIDRHVERLDRLGVDPVRAAADVRELKAAIGMSDEAAS
jgi:hypothetical protein